MNMDPNAKRILITVLACVVAAILVCVVLVGLINGVWPWSNSSGIDYTGQRPDETTTETTLAEGTTTETETITETETTGETTETSVPTTTEDEEEDKQTTEETRIPIDVEENKPTENPGPVNPADKTVIDFGEMYNPNKE